MAFVDKAWRQMLCKMAVIQGGLISLLIAGSYLIWGMEPIAGLLYGGAVTIATTLYSGWRFRQDTEARDRSAAMMMASLYKGTILRFLLVIALLVLGLRYFQLPPAAVISGFVVTQAGYFLGPLTARWGKQ